MTNEDLFENDTQQIRCSGCGKYFEETEVKRCKVCGEYFCHECQHTHDCRVSTINNSSDYHEKSRDISYIHDYNKDRIVNCSDCGDAYPFSAMKRCPDCNAILCPSCSSKHNCSKLNIQDNKNINEDKETPEESNYTDSIEIEELVKCDHCKKNYHSSEMKKCHNCGAVLCPKCRKYHICPTDSKKNNKNVIETILPDKEEIFVQCTECGRSIPKSKAKKCNKCGSILCKDCWSYHPCKTSILRKPNYTATNKSTISLSKIATCVIVLFILIVAYAIFVPHSDNTTPHIIPDTSASGTFSKYQAFLYEDELQNIQISVDSSIYYGAKKSDSSIYVGKENIIYPTIINEPHQDEFYAKLLSQFNTIKERNNLDDNQYVELITSYVQTIPYDDNSPKNPRYPVVTALDNLGDCDEKSMLLAGLLSKAGFDVVLFDFTAISSKESGHMTVGIRTNDNTAYINGYANIETTKTGWFITTDSISSDSSIKYSDMFHIGNGNKIYTTGYQVEAISSYKDKLEDRLNGLERDTKTAYNQYLITNSDYDWSKYENTYDTYSNIYNNVYSKFMDIYETAGVTDRTRLYNIISSNPT